jgi:two-component system response regulator YesN
MPDEDGLSLIEDTRKKIGGKPFFIFMSGLLDSNYKLAMEAGAFDYLEKPASLDKVQESVQKAIQSLKKLK